MTLPAVSVVGSILILCVCLYRLHTLSINDRFHVRITWVFLAGLSLLLPWTVLLNKTPAVVSPRIQVLDSSDSRILMKVMATTVRDCKVINSSVQAKKDGVTTSLYSRYYGYSHDITDSNDESGVLYVENKGFPPESISITLDHFCPFGIEVKTEVQEAREIFTRKGK